MTTECNEQKVTLLRNQENLCWFDSATFALFHKRRPELDNLFNDYQEPNFKIIESLYNHFSNKTPLTNLRQTVEDFRKDPNMVTMFNIYSKSEFEVLETLSDIPIVELTPPNNEFNKFTLLQNRKFQANKINNAEVQISENLEGQDYLIKITLDIQKLISENKIKETKQAKVEFDIGTDRGDDPGNFFNGLFKFPQFNTIQTQNGKTEDILIPLDYPNISLFDIIMLDNIEKKGYNYTNTFTLVMNRQGVKNSSTKTFFLETLVTKIKDEQLEFYLDAVIVHTGGYHYVVFVRCGNSDNWLLYNDASLGKDGDTLKLSKPIEGFEAMRNFNLIGYTNVTPNSHFQYLIYSRDGRTKMEQELNALE